MPVFNVSQFSAPDLSSITPKSALGVTTESNTVQGSASTPSSFDYDPDQHDLGGEIVNMESDPEAIVRIMFSQNQPTKEAILASGIPLYPGGSSYTIPAGVKLPLFAAIASGSARLVGNYFSSVAE